MLAIQQSAVNLECYVIDGLPLELTLLDKRVSTGAPPSCIVSAALLHQDTADAEHTFNAASYIDAAAHLSYNVHSTSSDIGVGPVIRRASSAVRSADTDKADSSCLVASA